MTKVLVIAGTADAREIIKELRKAGADVTATVTTKYGLSLVEEYEGVDVREGKLTAEGMVSLIREKSPVHLVDASHPFAREASLNAIMACKSTGTAYLRFERKHSQLEGAGIIRVEDFEEAAEKADSFDGNIFLTTGSNHLEEFVRGVRDYSQRLVARVLPDSRVIEKCEKAGLAAGNIIAMKGPFSEAMNVEMLKHFKASVMVTKESGKTGGTPEKLSAAASLGIPVVLIDRPEMDYGNKTDSIQEVVQIVLGGGQLQTEQTGQTE